MKFVVGREALGEAVAFVSRALATRPVVPLLSGILLEASGGSLTLSCFDYEVSAKVSVPAEVAEAGTALVPGRLLVEITRSLPARPVEFSDEVDAQTVTLTCGQAEFGLVCLPVADYPMLPPSPDPVGVIDADVLAGAVAQVAAAASRDDTLPMLTAICLEISGEVITLAATDRYRLAACEAPFAPAEPGVRAVALVPAKMMVEAARTLAAGTPVTIAFSRPDDQGAGETGRGGAGQQLRPADGMVSLESADRRLTARLIAGEFIKYRSRFPAEFDCHADLPAGPVIEAVRRASLVAEKASPVRLSFQPGQVVIEAHAEGRARAAETVTAEFAGDQPVISFNPHYLLDGLAAAAAAGAAQVAAGDQPHSGQGESAAAGGQGDAGGAADQAAGRIRIEFTTPAKPALITWVGADGQRHSAPGAEDGDVPAFRYLLVPLRVPQRA